MHTLTPQCIPLHSPRHTGYTPTAPPRHTSTPFEPYAPHPPKPYTNTSQTHIPIFPKARPPHSLSHPPVQYPPAIRPTPPKPSTPKHPASHAPHSSAILPHPQAISPHPYIIVQARLYQENVHAYARRALILSAAGTSAPGALVLVQARVARLY